MAGTAFWPVASLPVAADPNTQSSVGTIALNIAVAGVGAGKDSSVGTIALNIAVAGVGNAIPPIIILDDTHDGDKKRRKLVKDERARHERRRSQIIKAYEGIVEGKVEAPEPFIELVEREAKAKPSTPIDKMLADAAHLNALWEKYLDEDDEDVLALL